MAIICTECLTDACCHFKPRQPDPYIRKPEDQTPAKFGHLNHIIDMICCLSESELTSVVHDNTLEGDGTMANPLSTFIKVVVIGTQVFFQVTNPPGAPPGVYRVEAT